MDDVLEPVLNGESGVKGVDVFLSVAEECPRRGPTLLWDLSSGVVSRYT